MADLPLDLTIQPTGLVKPVTQTSTNGHSPPTNSESTTLTGRTGYGEGLEVEPISPKDFDANLPAARFSHHAHSAQTGWKDALTP